MASFDDSVTPEESKKTDEPETFTLDISDFGGDIEAFYKAMNRKFEDESSTKPSIVANFGSGQMFWKGTDDTFAAGEDNPLFFQTSTTTHQYLAWYKNEEGKAVRAAVPSEPIPILSGLPQKPSPEPFPPSNDFGDGTAKVTPYEKVVSMDIYVEQFGKTGIALFRSKATNRQVTEIMKDMQMYLMKNKVLKYAEFCEDHHFWFYLPEIGLSPDGKKCKLSFKFGGAKLITVSKKGIRTVTDPDFKKYQGK